MRTFVSPRLIAVFQNVSASFTAVIPRLGMLLSVLFVVACTTSTTSPDPDSSARKDPMAQKVSVTVSGPEMPVTTTTPLSWYADVAAVMAPVGDTKNAKSDAVIANLPDKGEVPAWMQHEIQTQMEAKGFLFTEDSTRYQVVGAMVLGEGEASTKAQALFRLFPTLAGTADAEHPKGTLLLGIWDSEEKKGVWRSALQTFADPHAPDAAKRQRLSGLVAEMLSKLEPARS